MRIAFYSDNFYPEISGISDSIITTGEELRRRGHAILYVAPWYPHKTFGLSRDAARDHLSVVRLPSVPFFRSPTGQSRVALAVGSSFQTVGKLTPDIIHVQSPYGAGIEGLRAARHFASTLVGTNHTPIAEFVRYLPTHGALAARLAQRYEGWYYGHCAITTAPCGGLIEEMRRAGFQAEACAQPNPVPLPASMPGPQERSACRRELDVRGPMILSAGRLAPEKHVDVILRAFAGALNALPAATLVVTGHGPSADALKRLAERLGVTERVRFVGFVAVRELERLYSIADAYVVMSTAESQSLSLMQAFAHGIPAVVARSRGLIDFTPPDAGFLVEPGDVTTLATRLTELLRDEERRRRMGAAGVEFVKRLSPSAMATQWEGIYERALAKRRTRTFPPETQTFRSSS